MSKKAHNILFVRIDKDKVEVECACGWTSKIAKSETEAREDHANHAKEKEDGSI